MKIRQLGGEVERLNWITESYSLVLAHFATLYSHPSAGIFDKKKNFHYRLIQLYFQNVYEMSQASVIWWCLTHPCATFSGYSFKIISGTFSHIFIIYFIALVEITANISPSFTSWKTFVFSCICSSVSSPVASYSEFSSMNTLMSPSSTSRHMNFPWATITSTTTSSDSSSSKSVLDTAPSQSFFHADIKVLLVTEYSKSKVCALPLSPRSGGGTGAWWSASWH